MLERIQNRACHSILNNCSYQSRITQIKLKLSLQFLNTHSDIALLSLFHKLIHSTRTTLACLKRPCSTSHRLHSHLRYACIYESTLAFDYSALPHAVRLWNSLLDSITCQSHMTHSATPWPVILVIKVSVRCITWCYCKTK